MPPCRFNRTTTGAYLSRLIRLVTNITKGYFTKNRETPNLHLHLFVLLGFTCDALQTENPFARFLLFG